MRVFLIFCAVLALQESGEQTLGTDVHRRIINGTDSPHRPFYVRIVITDTERKPATENFGGAIFNESFVITAAHIFAHTSNCCTTVKVMVGDFTVKNPQLRAIDGDFKVHEGYNNDTLKNDIVLIKLKETVDMDSFLPLCDKSYEGHQIALCGTGRTDRKSDKLADVLQELTFVEYSNASCPINFDEPDNWYLEIYYDWSFDDRVCLVSKEYSGPCVNDSGSPLYPFNDDSEPICIYGLTGWGNYCGNFSTYTRVSAFRDWIFSTMGKM
ncbi:trypsin-1-like [Convolutriloba macropyga]|uniref:trypsin-1-like n=1 Tax=Convolutriloba macropyga TaxID=536237 RepID=UPI003F51E249